MTRRRSSDQLTSGHSIRLSCQLASQVLGRLLWRFCHDARSPSYVYCTLGPVVDPIADSIDVNRPYVSRASLGDAPRYASEPPGHLTRFVGCLEQRPDRQSVDRLPSNDALDMVCGTAGSKRIKRHCYPKRRSRAKTSSPRIISARSASAKPASSSANFPTLHNYALHVAC